MNLKKKILLVLLLIVAVALGYLRDYIFVSINEKTGQGPNGSGELFIWKWPLTFAFALGYFALTCFLLHLIFAKKKYIYLVSAVYLFLFSVSFLVSGAGYFFSSFEKVYPFIRTVMGIAQSPNVMMILIAACYFNERILANKKNR